MYQSTYCTGPQPPQAPFIKLTFFGFQLCAFCILLLSHHLLSCTYTVNSQSRLHSDRISKQKHQNLLKINTMEPSI